MIISAPFRDRNSRLRVIAVIVVIGLLILLIDLFHVQVVKGAHYGDREEAQSLRRIRIPSARGEIVDRNGTILANNRPSYDIVIYLDQLGRVSKKTDIVKIAEVNLAALSAALHLPVTLSDRDVRIHYQLRRPIPMPVWKDLSVGVVAAFAERASNLPGADLIVTPVRQYPQGPLAAHVLGYVGHAEQNDEEELEHFFYYQPDREGKQGVERAYDEFLRGAPGGRTIRVNPGGVSVGEVGDRKAEIGNRVTLTLDTRIQKIVEAALANARPAAGRQLRGAAIVLDPRSGEVLAMASVPGFDPNIFNPATPVQTINALFKDPRSPMLNRAVGGRYAPGSTFKPVTLLAGLETGAINPHDAVACSGSMQIGNWPRPFRCWDAHGHGTLDALAAIKHSCDVWFYQEGMKTGVDAITKYATELGLGLPTGFELGRDQAGLVPTPTWKRVQKGERWWDGDTAQLAIGQSYLLATPLQMACVAATWGNRGTRWQPFIVKRIEKPNGEILHEQQPEVRGRVSASPQNIEFVRQAMLGAIQATDGTGHRAAVLGLSVAGKTGTAEFDTREGRIKRVWFIGFAPYENPQIALAVLIEDGESGGGTAAPVAGKILAAIFQKNLGAVGSGATYAD
jgi:penicillin-binding protein 2